MCSNLQWNTDKNNTDYVIKNKILRELIPKLYWLVEKIPGKYNFNRKKQINPIIIIKLWLKGMLNNWRGSLKFIKVEANRYPQIVALQVKEKFGGLRFYVQGATNMQYAVISWAESLSYHICEKCGSTKNIGTTEGWISTLCEECHDPNSNWKLNTD